MIQHMWDKFESHGDDFVAESLDAYRQVMEHSNIAASRVGISFERRTGMDVEVSSTKRLNQDYYRKCLLDLYDYRCCVT